MDQFTEDDLSSIMDSVEIPASELNCVNSVADCVQDVNHETGHVENSVCTMTDQSACIMPEQMALSNDEPPVVDAPLYGTALDPATLTVTSLEDYSDISSCSEADFLNILDQNLVQTSECQDIASSNDKNELETKNCHPGCHDAWASDKATQNQDDCRAYAVAAAESQNSSFDCVLDGDDQVESSLNPEYHASDLVIAEAEKGCPLKTEEQMKGGTLFQNTVCAFTEKNENKDLTITRISSVCALDLNEADQSIEAAKNDFSPVNMGIQNDCLLKERNQPCEIKNNIPECELKHDVKKTAHGDGIRSSQEVEYSSFEFLQSCFGLNSMDQTQLNNTTDFSLSGMTEHTQDCVVNHKQLVSATPASLTARKVQIKEATDGGLQEPPVPCTSSSTSVFQESGQQKDPVEDNITLRLAGIESTYDNGIKNSPSLVSSNELMRKLQPVVLVKTSMLNAKDGNVYECSVCQKNSSNLNEIIEHHNEHYKHTFQYCLTCDTYISNGTWSAHLCDQIGPKDTQLSETLSTTKQLTEKFNTKYQCKYCQKPFVKLSYHQDHEQRHRIVTQHRCDCCGLYFPCAKKLAAHKQKVKCIPLILDPSEETKECSKITPENVPRPTCTFGVDGCLIGLSDCFVKLVDINKKQLSLQKISCPVCGKRFKLRAQLKVHLKMHEGAKSLKCKKCKKVFKYSWNLEKHMKEPCSGNTSGPCFSESSFVGRFACPTCTQIYKYSYNRTRHMRERCLKEYMQLGKGKVANGYKCPLCSETFSLASNRNRHLRNICFQQYKLLRNATKMKLFKEEKEENQVLPTEKLSCYKCKVCPASFAYKSGVYRHMKKHALLQHCIVPVSKQDNPTDVEKSNSDNEKSQSEACSSKKSSDMDTTRTLFCNFCDKSFSLSESLKNHLHQHGGKKPFHCLDCGKKFGRRGHLITHKNVHKRRIQCSVCRKILPTIADLLKHRQSHIKKGLLQCPDCPLQFKYPVFLLRHVARHTKKEPMPSSLPAKMPSISSAEEKGKKCKESFCCGICKNSFVSSKAFSEHCLIHLPIPPLSKCPVCKKDFTSRIALVRHVRLHTGEKPFSCKTCGMRFHRKEPLSFHQEKCTGPQVNPLSQSGTAPVREKFEVKVAKSKQVLKKFKCSFCPHTFTMSGSLKLHEKAHLANNLVPCLRCGKYYKKNKIYEHRKWCSTKESTSGQAFKTESSGNAHTRECNSIDLLLTNRACRISKEIKTNVKESFKERCPHCSKRFPYRSYLLRHLHSHLGEKDFVCKHCGQKYGNRCSWKQHEALCNSELKHRLNDSEETKIKPASLKECTVITEHGEQLKCNFCTKTFSKPRYLRRHILTHTDVKPYHCKTCEKGFSRHDHLKLHQTRCKGKKQQLEVHLEQVSLDPVGSGAKKQSQSDLNLKVFGCNSCSKTFFTESNLNRHVSLQHSTFKPFSCKKCGTGFTAIDSLRRHSIRGNCKMSSDYLEPVQIPTKLITSVQCIEGNYSSKWKFPCEYCPRRFKTQGQLMSHTRLHTGEKPFRCPCCDERFVRKDYLKRHLSKCNVKRESTKRLCDGCGGLFTQETFEMHQNSCIYNPKSTDCSVRVSSISSPSKVKTFFCVTCNEQFSLFSQLQQHISTNHRSDGLLHSNALEYEQLSTNDHIKEEPVDDSYTENMPSSHQMYAANGQENTDCEKDKPFECEHCNMRFVTNSGLGMHMRTHTTVYPLSCQKCNKGFWSRNVQQKHLRKCNGFEVTNKETNIQDVISSDLECTPNDNVLVFNKGSNTTGTGVLQTKFSCKDQDNGNVDKGEAVVHKYQCSECEQSFTDGLMLISHLEAHGREDQERRLGKIYSCHICGKIFYQAGMLQRHVKIQHHTSVMNTCPECFRSFRYPSDLDIHRSCHDPNRPFVCDICKLRFWTSKSLSIHQSRSHSAIEPQKTVEPTQESDGDSSKVFTCHPCDKMYTIKSLYINHCMVKHKGHSEILDLKSTTSEHQMSNSESDRSDADDNDSGEDSDSAPYFPCHVCGKTFLTSESLEDHQRCHLGEKPYECEECGKCFIQLCNLQQHQRSHKSEFQCQMCGKGFVSLFALRKHKHTHVRKHPHRCTKCNLSFTKSSQLREHMITHRDEHFPCDLCHKSFSCKSSRAEHRKIHTETEEELPPLIPPAKRKSILPVSVSPSLSAMELSRYHCEICQVQFPDSDQLSEHGCNPAKERPYSCKDCNKHFLHGSHLKKHQLTHQLSGTRSFQCNSCHMSFSHRHHFLTHLQTHGGEESSKTQAEEVKISTNDDSNQDKIYRCPICPESFAQVLELANHLSVHANACKVCNKTFSTKQQLEKHEQCHLSAATQYECTECGKSFLGSDAFRQHCCVHKKQSLYSSLSTTDKKRCLKNSSEVLTNEEEEEVDVGEDFYNCPSCKMRFPSNVSLQEHQRLHHFDRPFKCPVCGKGFGRKKHLTRHQQIHNERPYRCDLCPRYFKTEQLVLFHRKIHCKFQCSLCRKSYRTPYDLAVHERKHAELQPFSEVSGDHRCDMCYKSFSQLSHLRQHRETHVGQVVYECTECDKAFAFLHLLEEHQQMHGTSTDSFQSRSSFDIVFQRPVIE